MKKTLIVLIAVIFSAEALHAIDLDASLSFGYTTLPGTVTLARGTILQKTYAPFDDGFICHSAAGVKVSDNIYAGLSTVFLKAGTKSVVYTEDANLLNVMAGGWYRSAFEGTSFSVTGRVFAGISFADLTQKDLSFPDGTYPMSGIGFAGDVLLEASYTFNDLISAIITLGYRKAYVPEFRFTEDAGIFYKKNDVYKDLIGDGKPIAYDFSGFVLSAGFGLNY
jgi:hypothetical protein